MSSHFVAPLNHRNSKFHARLNNRATRLFQTIVFSWFMQLLPYSRVSCQKETIEFRLPDWQLQRIEGWIIGFRNVYSPTADMDIQPFDISFFVYVDMVSANCEWVHPTDRRKGHGLLLRVFFGSLSLLVSVCHASKRRKGQNVAFWSHFCRTREHPKTSGFLPVRRGLTMPEQKARLKWYYA